MQTHFRVPISSLNHLTPIFFPSHHILRSNYITAFTGTVREKKVESRSTKSITSSKISGKKKKSNETRKNNPKERIIPKLRFICIFTFNYGHVTSFRNYRSKSRQESAVVGIGWWGSSRVVGRGRSCGRVNESRDGLRAETDCRRGWLMERCERR